MKVIVDKQLANGDWKQESITGVFNKNCMISYRLVEHGSRVTALITMLLQQLQEHLSTVGLVALPAHAPGRRRLDISRSLRLSQHTRLEFS